MDQLWAPWRMSYVTAPKTAEGDGGCFICRGATGTADRENLVLHRTDLSVVLLNRFPYNNGHLLVSPRAHRARLDELSAEELLDLQLLLQRLTQVIERRMSAEGFNVGLNLGRPAGAGLPGHLHWHIVPRWQGDVNFMPVVADARVIVQSLDALYDLLRPELAGPAG